MDPNPLKIKDFIFQKTTEAKQITMLGCVDWIHPVILSWLKNKFGNKAGVLNYRFFQVDTVCEFTCYNTGHTATETSDWFTRSAELGDSEKLHVKKFCTGFVK